MPDDELENGFMFALHILGSLGVQIDLNSIVAQLVSVARGELTLQPSPIEAIRSIESEAGRSLPEHLKQSVHRILSDRHQIDAKNQRFARQILNVIGVDPGLAK
jgi:hypothetical protein